MSLVLFDALLPPHVVTGHETFQIGLLASSARYLVLISVASDLASSAIEACSLLSLRGSAWS